MSGLLCPSGGRGANVIVHYLKESDPEYLVPLDELTELFREDFEREVADAQAPVRFDEGETTTTLVETAARMLEVFREKVPLPEAILGVEMAFSVARAPMGPVK